MAIGDVSDTNYNTVIQDHRAGPESKETFAKVSEVFLLSDILRSICIKRKTKSELCTVCSFKKDVLLSPHLDFAALIATLLCYIGHRINSCIKFICNMHIYFVLPSVLKCTEMSKQLWETFDPQNHLVKRSNHSDKRCLHIMLQQLLYIVYLHSA